MDKSTRYYRKIRAVFLLTAVCTAAAAILFLPFFSPYEASEENVFDVYVNGIQAGRTDEPERMEELLWQARENVAAESEEMLLITSDMELQGKSMVFGTVDSASYIREQMTEVLRGSLRQTLQRAYTVKINEYTVNLRSSTEVLSLLQACLDKYDTKGEYVVDLVVDSDRELNVLTPEVCRREEYERQEELGLSAGIEAWFADVCGQAEPAAPQNFEELDYGLKGLAFADTVEVVEAYLMEDELTELDEAISQVTRDQEKEQIYEVQAGDTLSQIALNHNLTVDGLVDINPSLTDAGSTIRVGDELIITVPEPELSVLHQELVYEEDSYEAAVEYVDVPEWYTTRSEVIQEPSAGYRKAASIKTYRNDDELSEEIVLESVEYEAVPKIIRRGTKVPPTYIKPISGGRLTSSYGRRSAPTKGASTNHQGTDWATPVGTAVMASCGGTVTRAGWGSGYGYVVYIQHADGRETRYGHLSKVLVSVGQHVDQGEKIALSGNTGRSTGPHLHFELRINGAAVNAIDYLN